jgi:small multidrug resistance family-3 protein
MPQRTEGDTMLRSWQTLPPLVFLIVATVLEATGDAIVRKALYEHAGAARLGLFLAGAALLLSYGTLLNLAPLEFSRVIGLYLATLFVVWQFINFIAFRTLPTLPILVGGAFIVAGGVILTYWRAA